MKSYGPMYSVLLLVTGFFCCCSERVYAAQQAQADRKQAAAALQKAVRFFQQQVSIKGGYLWRYSADLEKREGEEKASPSTAWVQPPGTPSVGEALLRVYQRTGDRFYLDATRQTAKALVQCQLHSGGWSYRIEFDPAQRRHHAYRTSAPRAGTRNVTTLDDNTTQAALRFLMHLDRELKFKDQPIHEATTYCLDSLLKAQYPNGAWPQRFSAFPEPGTFPVRKASYPGSWSRKYPGKNYQGFYTFNDNTMSDVIDVMFEATEIYRDTRYLQAAKKCGDFILLAQMPDPQPAWAQQYNLDCQPAWARKFEPASVTGGESQGIMRTLMKLYRKTGQAKYLEAVEPALKYLESSQLPGGKLARFYELKTNKPLYFTRQYELTYEANDLPTHYGFIVGSNLPSIRKEYERLCKQGPDQPRSTTPAPDRVERLTDSLQRETTQIIMSQDKRGAWVTREPLQYQGSPDTVQQTISTSTFIRHVDVLSRYLAATRPGN
ncbi:MAG: polysaccharide lyase [Pirellulaceae bacterium]|nr:polysaccharide lyase [Pirellulaceae bacterium]